MIIIVRLIVLFKSIKFDLHTFRLFGLFQYLLLKSVLYLYFQGRLFLIVSLRDLTTEQLQFRQ